MKFGNEVNIDSLSENSLDRLYFAKYTEPCGRSLLEISKSENGPFEMVQPIGGNFLIKILNYDILVLSNFKVLGKKTGKTADDLHCGKKPEFYVEKFEPWGKIRRCTAIGVEGFYRYMDYLPTHSYAAEDYSSSSSEMIYVLEKTCSPKTARCEVLKSTSLDSKNWKFKNKTLDLENGYEDHLYESVRFYPVTNCFEDEQLCCKLTQFKRIKMAYRYR
ncbi:hypothetical protein MAL08_02210 [Leptospira noguchii]|uniref:hypothetical protein n=1 Tax=Leptospira noguchii TaxID=28182 RepID=UPI001FB847F6|nr:hypothetical protein [Leptospira noguchii]UOG39424.1 hypothetical protein MAL08_02210 [Leptospira noguchii]